MVGETRRGLMAMAGLLLPLIAVGLLVQLKLGAGQDHTLIYGALIALSLNTILAARHAGDLRTLHLLGTVLLIISATAFILLAHRTGDLSGGLLTSIVLLIVIVPMMPWGLRDATLVVCLSYCLLSLSSISVSGRFDADSLLSLQFVLLAAGSIALSLVARNAGIRKQEIAHRYELEQAHRDLQALSTRDPLTGCLNRRFLQQNFSAIAEESLRTGQPVQIALLDVDCFKSLNDSLGHQHGDRILKRLVAVFQEALPGNTHLVRLGGDEFAIVGLHPGLRGLTGLCLDHLATDPVLLEKGDGRPVEVSAGFATGPADELAELAALYRDADVDLYANKTSPRRRARTTLHA